MSNKYTSLQIGIHWLVFLLVIVTYCAMELRGFAPRSYRPWINMVHVSCGMTILVLMVTRLLVQTGNTRRRPLCQNQSRW
ncbi:cytochrome b561 [Citrobacter koseri]|uniref:Cytochrome b561 n=1 Tax=Citrobacter koseri TaxID=545 RepID=A0A2X2WFA1_CITKO|nr:cytochrome b561 [Citrobacter koseri]